MKHCPACAQLMVSITHEFCGTCRKRRKAPAVYRFVCPDGRSYVGSTPNHRTRNNRGIARTNRWLVEVFGRHLPDTWVYEVLETLPPGCSKTMMEAAEQRHIDRLDTTDPAHGFNVRRADNYLYVAR